VNTGTWVLLIAVVAALAFGLFRALTDGRFRGTHRVHGLSSSQTVDSSVAETVEEPARKSVLEGTPWAADLGERATLLQFSSAFCAPCRAARRVLGDVSSALPGVVHLEVDAEHHLDVVRRFGILRTPTTLVLDQHGHEVTRATGAPTRQQVMSALGKAVPDTEEQPPSA
jgi:thiol-disulfide isomerase/thioredoxin